MLAVSLYNNVTKPMVQEAALRAPGTESSAVSSAFEGLSRRAKDHCIQGQPGPHKQAPS